ncbi:MAG TPA: hypothetical protein DEQ43_12210 [Nocardioides bacterium]|uniref:YqjF family protein n=1 Tax=uncultured Nocardioides sp. TaxID=198441 RepID=UPI000EDAB2BF|nr:DUF2071 domain-containing protein [uncultured Nocardioides sp.]HCB04985.1 hypothetical protein [Nocardioides sp.]
MSRPAEPITREAPPLSGRVVSTQRWRDLTFLHWAVDPGAVARLLPPGTRPDLFEDRTYVGLVPFRMVRVTLGRLPIPYVGTFLETNVRLYSVDDQGRRAVVFLSLDVDRAAVVPAVRATVGAPYRWARMRFDRRGDVVTYDARVRTGRRATSHVVVRAGEPRAVTPLDDFLTARWAAHVRRPLGTTYVRNRHDPWPLRSAEVVALDDGLVADAGLPGLTDRPPDHVAFSDGVYAEFTRPRRVAL